MRKVYLCERCDKSYSCVTRRDVESPFYTEGLINHKEVVYASSEDETSTAKVFPSLMGILFRPVSQNRATL